MSTSTQAHSTTRSSGLWAAAQRSLATRREAAAERRSSRQFEAYLAVASPAERGDLRAIAAHARP